MSEGYVPAELRRTVIARAERLCEYCLIHEDDTFFGCEVDHIIAEKHGGPTVAGNLAYACLFCNRHKGSDLGSILRRTGAFCRFYHPRTDDWAGHFRLDGPQISPITDVAEVTARILGFNTADRTLERAALLESGRYPSPAALTRMSRPTP